MEKKQRLQLATKHNVTDQMIWYLLNKDRKTMNFKLAADLSAATGEPAITYIPLKLHETYRLIYGNGKRAKKSA